MWSGWFGLPSAEDFELHGNARDQGKQQSGGHQADDGLLGGAAGHAQAVEQRAQVMNVDGGFGSV